MDRLHYLSVLSVLFACSMVTGQYRWYNVPEQRDTTRPPYSYLKYPVGNRYWRHHHCRESNLQYDCIFSHVSIVRGSHGIRFGHLDITANNQKNITFKDSIIRKLPETLLDSFLQAELLNLTGLQIEEIEPFALTNGNIRELYLGFNVIRELPKFVFRNMRYLRVLVLDRNNLSSLPEGMLYATPNIVKLSIANNKLKRIDDSTFKKCKTLQYLTVSNNELTHIDLSLIPSLFRGNVSYNKLQTLSVPEAVIILDASHNLINTVTGPINPELAILCLQDNNLTDTAFLWHYSGLVDLDLSFNQLEMITFDHFSEMNRLERLYLANNRLEVLNLDPAPIPKLQILDVRRNYLLDVERNQNQFNTLEQLYLDHNSIVTLKLSPNNTLQNLTLSNNDWDCKSLDELFKSVHESIILDSDNNCKPDYQLKQNLCCSRYEQSQYSYGNLRWPVYKCREDFQNYNCVFHDVSIDRNTPGAYFGYENVTLNNQKRITFKNSTMRKLSETLVNSYGQIELLDLSDLQIEEIAPRAFTNGYNIQELYMGFNDIQKLPYNAFSHMKFLLVLVLDRNYLRSLSDCIFDNNPNLVALTINNNNLEEIGDNAFQYTKDLQNLELSSNKLAHIDLSRIPSLTYGNVSFNRLTTLAIPMAIEILDASYNQINTVTGPNNYNLTHLYLQHNNLTEIAWIMRYPVLIVVDLSYNELEKITYKDFNEKVYLKELYLSHNRLVALNFGTSSIPTFQFDTLTQLYLDHNSIVTLKLSPNNTLQKLTLSNNDWDCSRLDVLFGRVHESIILDNDQNCKPDYELKHNLCCKVSDKPFLDRLKHHFYEISIAEKIERSNGRCSATDALTRIQNLTDYVNQHAGSRLLQSNPQLQAEINQLQVDINQLTYQQTQLDQFLKSMQIEIDNYLRRYNLTKDELLHPSENLHSVFDHLNSRRAFKEQKTKLRQSQANHMKQYRDTTEQENRTLEIQLVSKKFRQEELKNAIRAINTDVKKLEAWIIRYSRIQ
uniref:LRIM1/APL1C-like dimerization domain-containing protein n=1 Tax=Anopheles funestus TaxID=62324 RepID=A0A182R298_ANOFN